MTHHGKQAELPPGQDHAIDRAPPYRGRRDFVIRAGDGGRPRDYPAEPAA